MQYLVKKYTRFIFLKTKKSLPLTVKDYCCMLSFMKIWIKYFAGILLGCLFAFLLPDGNQSLNEAFRYISTLVVNFGRYALYPVLFFSFTVGVYELRESRTLLKTGIGSLIVIAGATAICALVGTIGFIIYTPARIPIFIEGTGDAEHIGILESLLKLFPPSAFEAFLDGAFILPLCIFAGFLGAGCAADRISAKPMLTLFDSFSRVSYAIMCFFVDIVSIGMIAVSVYWFFLYREMHSFGFFGNFIIILLINVFFIGVILYPLLLRLICGIRNPYRVLYASLAPVLAAFFSGDTNMTLPVILRHVNESLGVRRRISSISVPMFSIFSRPGSAVTVIVSFVVILNSYSSLGIAFADILWLFGVSILFSFFLSPFPSGGAYVLLAAVCSMYGRGFEAGYLILRPAAFFICSAAAAIDALTAVFGTCVIAQKMGMRNDREIRFFI